MRHALIAPVLLLAACGKAERPAQPELPAGHPTVAPQTLPEGHPAAPAAGAGPQAVLTVLYQWPKDTIAFERYYIKHLKLLEDGLGELKFSRAQLTRFIHALDGGKPAFYRQAQLFYPSLDAAKAAMATPAFKRVADDLPNFATGGLLALIAQETGTPDDTDCKNLVTVLYETPKDTAAFERYYPTHLGIVGKGQKEIGFFRAELTRFTSNLDGTTPAAKHRQAVLCFPSMQQVNAGMKTPAFAAVGADFANFVAPKGLTGMIGVKTN
ncbi:MAG: EthD family reductase [Gemmatimonadales bacterium]|nr:EthD family reductase [Gemmatimonadales bacterium]